MVKKLEIPFFKNSGWECGQACMAMTIKYYYPDFEPNFHEINKIIRAKKNKYTFTSQLVVLLDYFKVRAKWYSSENELTTNEDPNMLKRWYGKDYDYEVKYVDIESLNWSIGQARKKGCFEVKNTKFSELINCVKKGFLVGIPIDWNTMIDKKGPYEGHFVILSGINGNKLFIHDPDTGPFIEYEASQIEKAWRHPAITEDCIVAYGRK